MATIQELQTRLDEKTFDPSALNDEQRAAVNIAFEQGALKGYKNVEEVERERAIGSKIIASQKEKRNQPFTTATQGIVGSEGVTRSDLELVGDVTAAGYVYMKDMPKIRQGLLLNPSGGFGIDKLQAAATDFNKWEKALQKLPMFKGARILNRTGRAIGKVMDGFRTLGKAPTQALVTEVKAQLAGNVGAGGGSVLYDMANMATDFDGAVMQDLSEISDNEVKKLPYAQQVLVHSMEAMNNAAFYNLAGSSLGPILGQTLRGMKGFLGLGSKETKELAEAAQKNNITPSIATLAQSGTIGGKIISAFEKIFGVIPLVNIFGKRQRKRIEEQTFRAMLDEVTKTLGKVPIEHVGLMNYKFLPTMKKNFEQSFDMIRDNYDVVDKIADSMGNPKFIPTNDLKQTATKIVKEFEASRAEPFLGKQTDLPYGQRVPEYGAAKNKGSLFADPLFDTVNKAQYFDDFITPKQYQGFMQDLVNAMSDTKMKDARRLFFDMSVGAKNSFNKVANPDNVQGYLSSSAFKAEYESILESSGKETADKFAMEIQKGMNDFGEELASANGFFSQTVQGFNTPVAKKIRNSEANVFATKGLMGVVDWGNVATDEIWEKSIQNIYKGNSAAAIKELAVILGTKNKRNPMGKELFNRARVNFLWDSLLTSYNKQPMIGNDTVGAIMDKARELGVINYKGAREIMERAGTREIQEVRRIDPELATKYKLGEVDAEQIRLQAKEVGEFNIKLFKERLGLIRPGVSQSAAKDKAIEKFAAMYGGGAEGYQAARDLIKLVDIMDKEFGKHISDSNAFLMRRIMLSGGGQAAIAGGIFAGAAASGGIVAALPVTAMLALGGYLLANPASLKYMLDVFTDVERMNRTGRKVSPTNVPKSFFRLLNYLDSEDKDFPDVDPKRIDFEEVTDYLLNKNILIPQLGFSPQAVDPKLQSRYFPELGVIDRGSEANAAGGINFLKGSEIGAVRAQTMSNLQPQNTQTFQRPAYEGMVAEKYLPQNQMKNMPQNQMQQPKPEFESIFPNDSLGIAIANRNKGQQ